jgi:hypothetical protein
MLLRKHAFGSFTNMAKIPLNTDISFPRDNEREPFSACATSASLAHARDLYNQCSGDSEFFSDSVFLSFHRLVESYANSSSCGEVTGRIAKYYVGPGDRAFAAAQEFHLLPFVMTRFSLDSEQQAFHPACDFRSTGGAEYHICPDAPFGDVIFWKGTPQALVAYRPCDPDTLMICQIQGTRGYIFDLETGAPRETHNRGLAKLRWKDFLVEHVAERAKTLGFRNLKILAPENNPWVVPSRVRDGPPHMSLEKAKEIYDTIALRHGFEKASDGNWHKSLL